MSYSVRTRTSRMTITVWVRGKFTNEWKDTKSSVETHQSPKSSDLCLKQVKWCLHKPYMGPFRREEQQWLVFDRSICIVVACCVADWSRPAAVKSSRTAFERRSAPTLSKLPTAWNLKDFSGGDEVKEVANEWIKSKPKKVTLYFDGVRKLVESWTKCTKKQSC